MADAGAGVGAGADGVSSAAPSAGRVDESGAPAASGSASFFALFSFADPCDCLLMALGTLGAIGHGLAFPVFFYLFGNLINSFGVNSANPDATAHDVSKYALDLVYLGLGVWASSWAEVACWMHTGQRQVSRIRVKYLQAILSQDIGFFDTEGHTGILVESIAKDTVLIQEAISEKMGNFIHFMSTCIGGYGVGFSSAWKLCLVTLAAIPAIAFAGGLYAYTVMRLTSQSQEAYGEAGIIAEQNIAHIRTVFSFTGEIKAELSFSESLARTIKLGYKGGLAKGLGMGVTYGILSSSWGLIVWYGGVLIHRGESDGGKAISAIFPCILGGMALGQAMTNVPAFSKGKTAAHRIFSMLKRLPKMDRHQKDEGLTLADVKGDIELRNIIFSYPSRPDVEIFHDFSLKIPSRKTLALVGGSGSGKSTIVSLIERFYDPLGGQVLLDGVDIRFLQLRWLRDQIGLVNQEPCLFATSISENILYGKEKATMEEVELAAKVANAHSFISKFPHAYKTQVGEHGVQLSGGQKQRVAIARAMLKNPNVLLLDEATSALDAASEKIVQDTLNHVMIGRTTVIIAHRLSTIQNVDMIGVVQDGKIVEMGTHSELASKGDLGAYSTLVKQQEMALSCDGTTFYQTSKVASSIAKTNSARGDQLSKSSRRVGSERQLSHPRQGNNSLDMGMEKVEEARWEENEVERSKGFYWRLVALNTPEWPYAVLGSIGAVIAGIIGPVFAFFVGEVLTTYYSTDKDGMKKDVERFALIYVGIGVLSIVGYLLQYYNFGIVGENLTVRIREMMLKAMMQNEVGWFDLDENNSKRLAARLSTEATHVRAALSDKISLLVHSTAGFVTAFAIALILEWRLALVLIATLPLIVSGFVGQLLCVKGFAGNLDKAYSYSIMIAGDSIGNIRTIAAFNAENKVVLLFSEALHGPARRSFLRGNLSGGFYGLSQMCIYSSYALVLWYGSQLVKSSRSDFGSVIKVFMVLIVTAFFAADTLVLAPDLAKGSEALASVFQILDRRTKINPDDPSSEAIQSIEGIIELRDVEFAYPGRPDVTIFKGLQLMVEGGESVALVGPSGSGKSSVIGLVERFYDPLKGEVLIDGKNIQRLNLRSLRQRIGLVQQEPALFATSIYSNIEYGKEGATEAEVEAAARAANAHGFISGLAEGYGTRVGERGVQLSGGQKQRVAIARAVLKDPSILLLDEATSALDAESEKVVQEALDKLMENRTTIVVAHRLSTIRNARRIAVLHDGRILEQGSHDQLMHMPGSYYAHLVNIQRARDN